MTRWSQYECEQWAYSQCIQMAELPELWCKWETEWEERLAIPPLSPLELMAPLYQFYRTYKMRISEWRAELYSTNRILHDRNIPTQYLEIENPIVFENLPDSEPQYEGGDIFHLLGSGGCRMEMCDFQTRIRDLRPRYAMFLTPGWTEGNVAPEFRSDILSVDTAAYGDVVMDTSNVFCYGGVNRNHCGFGAHAHVLRTLAEGFHASGFEIAPDPEGAPHRRLMDNETGAVLIIVTDENTWGIFR